MKESLLIERETRKIYSLDESRINKELIKSLLERMGYKTIHLNSLQTALEVVSDEKRTEKPAEMPPQSHLLEKNISDPELKNLLKDFYSVSKWFAYLLNRSNIGFCIIDKSKYLMYNNHFSQIIQYSHQEMESLTPGDLTLLQHRVKIRDMIRKISTNKISSVDMSFETVTGNRNIIKVKAVGYRILLEHYPIGMVYLYEEGVNEMKSEQETLLKQQAINELHDHVMQLVYTLSLKNMPLIDHPHNGETFFQKSNRLIAELTRREKEVLKWIATGYSNKKIAERLHISIRTVEFHRSNLLSKTRSKNTAELVRFALNHKLADS
mgnify:CR=1 FL=1